MVHTDNILHQYNIRNIELTYLSSRKQGSQPLPTFILQNHGQGKSGNI